MLTNLHFLLNKGLITNDAVVLGLLLVTLGGLFYTDKLKSFQKIYKYVPLLLLCYFIPAIFNSVGLVDGEASGLYYMASRYLLPASLVLLCLSIDLKGIINLGPKALIMFFTATIGIVVGGPVGLYLTSKIKPSINDYKTTLTTTIHESNDRLNLQDTLYMVSFSGDSPIVKGDILLFPKVDQRVKVDSIHITDSNEILANISLYQNTEEQDDPNIPKEILAQSANTEVHNTSNQFYRGLSTLAGSWIGGGANQSAMLEISRAPTNQFSAMVIVDVFVANIWMAFLLIGAGMTVFINKKLKADNSAVDALQKKVEDYQASISRTPTFTDLAIIFGIGFGCVGVGHLLADLLGPAIGSSIKNVLADNPDSSLRYLTSLGSKFFWLILISTFLGILLSFTKAKTYEGAGASKLGSIFLYVLVATIGMKMNIPELIDNWSKYWPVIVIGLIWMLTHVTILLIVAKIIKAPFFYVAVGSQANVGGAASAPIVASAFSPALAPVGVLLAVLGYAVGTVGAIVCMEMMKAVSL